MACLNFFNKSDKISIISNDAGATNLIISWISLFNGEISPYMSGPAKKLWLEQVPEIKLQSLKHCLSKTNVIITGSGWGSKSERTARKFAKINNIRSISIVDHWTNYQIRFSNWNDLDIPDEIWVADLKAKKKVEAIYPQICVRCLPNLYLKNSVREIKHLTSRFKNKKKKNILYLLEPIKKNWPGYEMPEIQALNYFIQKYQSLVLTNNVEIILRLHPSEDVSKYSSWIESISDEHKIKVSDEQSLNKQIAWADIIFGCETYAMEIAASSGKPTYSTIPPWGHKCRLQHPDIKQLSKL